MFFSSSRRISMWLLGVAIGAGTLAAGGSVAQAKPMVYEPFNYHLANGTVMDGVRANALGLKGRYVLAGGKGKHPRHDAVFNTAKLLIKGLPKPKGSVTIKSTGGTDKPCLSVKLNAALPAGATLYGGYVFRHQALTGVAGYVVSSLLLGRRASSDATANIDIANAAFGTPNGYIRVGVDGNGAYAFGVGRKLKLHTTYIELFQISGINATSGPVAASEWTLSGSQFAHFQGHLTATTLNAAPIGTATGDVTQEATLSDAKPPVYPRMGKVSYLGLFSYGLKSQFGTIGLSTKSLADAMASNRR